MKTIEELAIKVGRDMRCEFPADEWDNPDEHSQESYTFYKSEMQEYGTRLIAAWQAEHAEPVGETVGVPGSQGGFSMSVFKAVDVPIGTKLFLAPQPAIPEGMAPKAAAQRGK